MDRVFRIQMLYQPRLDPVSLRNNKRKDRWLLKTKQLFDNEREYNKQFKLAQKKLQRKTGGLFEYKLIADEFINGTWENLVELTTMSNNESKEKQKKEEKRKKKERERKRIEEERVRIEEEKRVRKNDGSTKG